MAFLEKSSADGQRQEKVRGRQDTRVKQMTNVEKIIINSMFADGFNAEKHFLLLAKRRTHILLKIIIPRIEFD